MKFEKLAELADDITISDENRNRVFQNCKKEYEQRKKHKISSVFFMLMLKLQ